jgi:GT2 family glycosyltransferase/glycosyltransferase involved in cell wall biosynthesis
MKISIITPSFNQAQFLPFNLSSVRAQKGGCVEHIIVDPGSKDGSTGIARQAEGVVLIAEPDRGQSDGICKGFGRSTGEVLTWLNSDDFYPDSEVVSEVLKVFEQNPDIDVVYGDVNFVDEKGKFLRKGFVNPDETGLLQSFEYQVGIVQPGLFLRKRVFDQVGGPSEEFEYCMDYEYWVRIAKAGFKWKYVPRVLAHHRWWDGMKTSFRRDLSLREHFKVCDRYFGYVHWRWLDRYAEYLCSKQDGIVNHATEIPAAEKANGIRRAIDEIVTEEMLRILDQSQDPEKVETKQYIKRNYPQKKRIYYADGELDITAEHAGAPNAFERVAWHIFNAATRDGRQFSAYHVPGNFDRYFDRGWHRRQLARTKGALDKMARDRRGDTCIIVGNGPSLRNSDLFLLANVDAIVSNFAAMSPELNRYAKILTVVNDLVAKQGAVDFNANRITKVMPFWLANYLNEDKNTFFVDATVRPEFGTEFVSAASWRSTVSFFNMQLAYALGYRKVILIGFDHSYVQPRDVVEGDVISQKGDDENHFDPRYFKGKDWQAADTVNMEKMYVLAKAAFEADGREIVNCTVGGRLEVFRRGYLATELGDRYTTTSRAATSNSPSNMHFPRLLLIDSTPVGGPSATGQIKQMFLDEWPADRLMQIYEEAGALRLERFSGNSPVASGLTRAELLIACRKFRPDVIYFRPVDSDQLFEFAEVAVNDLARPLVIHMMDDWPDRLRAQHPVRHAKLDRSLRDLLSRASRRLSISDAMSEAYLNRYGLSFLPLANGIDVDLFPAKNWGARGAVTVDRPFVIRYMGGLANDMTLSSVVEFAKAVSGLSSRLPVQLEVFTMPWYMEKAREVFSALPGVTVQGLVSTQDYPKYLCDSDTLLIAYNFDEESIRYVGLSMANKLPECLAAGVPLIAYGPKEVATIAYLEETKCARVVSEQNCESLSREIEYLVTHLDYCRELGGAGREYAGKNHNKEVVKGTFLSVHQAAVKQFALRAIETQHENDIRPLTRDAPAHPGPIRFRQIIPGRQFEYADPGLYRYVTKESGSEKNRVAVVFDVDCHAGLGFVAGLTIRSNTRMQVLMSVGPFGDSPYEGSHKTVGLYPGVEQAIVCENVFAKRHAALEIQLEVVSMEGGTADLWIADAFLNESALGIRQRIEDSQVELRTANRLFRNGDYAGAMALYLQLSKMRPMAMYGDNALASARKLKWGGVSTVQDLVQRLNA